MSAEADPHELILAAACDLMADVVGARLCGVVALDGAVFVGASSELCRLPAGRRRAVAEAVAGAVRAARFTDGVPRSSQPVEVRLGELGEASALLFVETDVAAFAVLAHGRTVDAIALRQAAAAILPLLYHVAPLRAERARFVQCERLLTYVGELAHVGGWEQTLATGRLIWSDEVYAMHGLERGEPLGLEQVLALYPSPAREKLVREIERATAEGGGFDITAPVRTPAGDQRILRTVGRSSGGGALYGITQDVTTQLSAERRMWWAANHDPVTSLPNRLLFEDRIATAVHRARRDRQAFALILLDIADAARAGDATGFTVPDKHMLEVAGRLGSVTRESDTVARLSQSEFALILHDVKDPPSLAPPMARLTAEIADLERLDPQADIVASVGVAFYPEHATGPEDLTRAAEMALGRARRTPEERIVVYGRTVADDVARRRKTILAQAREGLGRGEFAPHYQAQFDMETGEVVGVEALVRWQSEDVLMDAKDFAYVLGDHEVGASVGRAVLDAVIADVARLRTLTARRFRVSVNASRAELLRNDFLDTFLAKTRSGNLMPQDFTIEITEDVILGVDDQTLQDKVSFLASSGVEFALDDFGTGYASLIHITSFPIAQIKIDKQFVSGIETDGRKRAIVRGIVGIARSLGLNIVAEGVETVEQRDVLRGVGCRVAQGYLYAVPLPFDEFVALLSRSEPEPRRDVAD